MAVTLEQAALIVIGSSLFLFGILGARAYDHLRGSKKKRADAPVAVPQQNVEEQLRELVEKGGNAHVVMEGGFRLREFFASTKGFTVRGAMTLDDDSVLDSPVEVFGNTTLGARARVARPLFVHGDLILGNDARVPSCRVDGNVFFHPGSAVDGALRCNAAFIMDTPMDEKSVSEGIATLDLGNKSPSTA